jgi:folate-binding protein YgfZ
LWCLDENHFGLEVPAGSHLKFQEELLAAIEQYTFAEKMTLAPLGPEKFDCLWIFPEPGSELSTGLHSGQTKIFEEEEVRLCRHSDLDFDRAWISAWGRPERLRQWAERTFLHPQNLSHSELQDFRIQACRPWPGAEISDQVTPLDVGLPDAVAENKGCYPGQEIIEKIAALGSPAKRLVRVQTEAATNHPVAGTKLYSLSSENPLELGEVTTSTGHSFLAIVRKTHAKEGAELRIEPTGPLARVTRVAPYLKADSAHE